MHAADDVLEAAAADRAHALGPAVGREPLGLEADQELDPVFVLFPQLLGARRVPFERFEQVARAEVGFFA